MDYRAKITRVVELLRQSKKTLALTGAGISTESGIPDYRSPGTGLWEKINPAKAASLSSLRRDPAAFYDMNLERWTAYTDARPNDAHLALARLEEKGYLLGVITQNIDGLHIKAGSRRVWEVHGHLRTCRCMKCSERYPFDHLVEQYRGGQNPPLCRCGGVLRPDVVLFEDQMSDDYFQAVQVMSGCQLLLVVGSSLTVYPVAELPRYARTLVIVNKTPTPWDGQAEVVIHESAGQVFRDIMSEVEATGG